MIDTLYLLLDFLQQPAERADVGDVVSKQSPCEMQVDVRLAALHRHGTALLASDDVIRR